MSKHQELCCGCINDCLGYEFNCWNCEYIQGEHDLPTSYESMEDSEVV